MIALLATLALAALPSALDLTANLSEYGIEKMQRFHQCILDNTLRLEPAEASFDDTYAAALTAYPSENLDFRAALQTSNRSNTNITGDQSDRAVEAVTYAWKDDSRLKFLELRMARKR